MSRLISLFLCVGLLLGVALAAAHPAIPSFIPITPEEPKPFTYTVPLEATTWEEAVAQLAQAPQASPPTDSCAAAPLLNLTLPADGGQAVVNSYSEEALDPVLGCMWGTPTRPQGYRTAWYKLVAPTGGHLVVEALPNANYQENYDTVIAIHHAPNADCNTLQTLTCNDDHNGFLSRASATVQQGETYYIEVADWHFGVNGIARLSVLAYITQSESFWEHASDLAQPLSRHVAVPVGDDIYVIGGLHDTGVSPSRTNANLKFNTATRTWSTMTPMPDVGCLDINGYAATDAVYFNGKIFIPSGYAGNNNQYCGMHMIYHLNINNWTVGPSAPWPQPLGWTQTVAYAPFNGYFVVGGLAGAPLTPTASADIYLYLDAGGGTWHSGLPQMSQARYGHTAALVGNRICVVGGINASNQVITGGECFDINSSTWSAIPPLQYPRFAADSAVGPDGRWYVFGGTNATISSVPQVEVYNPATNSWSTLDARHNLGELSGSSRPARSWVRGGFVGRDLWVFGGEQDVGVFNHGSTLPFVERLTDGITWPTYLALPFMASAYVPGEPNDTFAQAQPHPPYQTVAYNFESNEDYFDIYQFYQPQLRAVSLYLQQIPDGANYDLLLYNGNKSLLASSRNIGNLDEFIHLALGPGQYYVVVVRAFPLSTPPPSDYYTLRVEN